MNYLAHILLSGDHPGHQVGGLLGDFVKGPLLGLRPIAIEQGIWLHRQLDAWFDRQPGFKRAQERLGKRHRRVSGIALDLIFDHFLARHWQDYHHQPLELFTTNFYQHLSGVNAYLPANAKRFLAYSQKADILAGYIEFERLQVILQRMDERRQRPLGLAQTYAALEAQYRPLLTDFLQLMPLILAQSEIFKGQLPQTFKLN